jgi:Ser/Thr protein kinase RdoA (MazF antagonist)
VLLHIHRVAPSLPVPRLIRTLTNETEFCYEAAGTRYCGGLSTFLPGELLQLQPSTARSRYGIGDMAARLDLALQGFRHPAENRTLLWDSMNAPQLINLTPSFSDKPLRLQLEAFLDHFAAHVYPHARLQRAQAIHNDLTGSNLLVCPTDPERLVGVLDFGDMVYAPLINELATCASYQLGTGPDPLCTLSDLLAGYHNRLPLEEPEVALLYELILARLAIRVVLTEWRSVLFPANRDYILRNSQQARQLFEYFMARPFGPGRDQLLRMWHNLKGRT